MPTQPAELVVHPDALAGQQARDSLKDAAAEKLDASAAPKSLEDAAGAIGKFGK